MKKRLVAFDFDGCLFNTPDDVQGKKIWKSIKGEDYKYEGWWGRPESLDLDVFDIKPYAKVLTRLRKEVARKDTYVIVLTARHKKLRAQVQAVLDANDIKVDRLDMKAGRKTKGEKILDYLNDMPELKEILVYDDQEKHLDSYRNIKDKLPKGVELNIFKADDGKLKLVEAKNKLFRIIKEEIENLF